jgi:hypothetical protein
MVDSENGHPKPPSPPYTAWQTIKNLIASMKEHGLPGQIDRSVLTNMSGAVQSQVITALKFLGLIGLHDNAPRTPFKLLVEAYGTDKWQTELTAILKSAYQPIFQLQLETASPNQFNDKFRAAYPAEGDTFRKCVTFFLNAARDAGIPISAYIMRNKKPRTVSTKKRTASKAPRGNRGQTIQTAMDDDDDDEVVLGKTPFQVLMEDIYDPSRMDPGSDEERSVFVLARYLKVREAEE